MRPRFDEHHDLPDIAHPSVLEYGHFAGQVILEPTNRIVNRDPLPAPTSPLNHNPIAMGDVRRFVNGMSEVASDGGLEVEVDLFFLSSSSR